MTGPWVRDGALGSALLLIGAGLLLWSSSQVIGSPPHEQDYIHAYEQRVRWTGCAPYDSGSLFGIFPDGGGDDVILGPGAVFFVYDTSSPHTLAHHDRLFLYKMAPSDVHFTWVGGALVLCSPQKQFGVVIARAGCRGKTKGGQPWNNRFEEITFSSGETWLTQELINERKLSGAPYPQHAKLNEMFAKYSGPVSEANYKAWRVRSMRDAGIAEDTPLRCAADSAEKLRLPGASIASEAPESGYPGESYVIGGDD